MSIRNEIYLRSALIDIIRSMFLQNHFFRFRKSTHFKHLKEGYTCKLSSASIKMMCWKPWGNELMKSHRKSKRRRKIVITNEQHNFFQFSWLMHIIHLRKNSLQFSNFLNKMFISLNSNKNQVQLILILSQKKVM